MTALPHLVIGWSNLQWPPSLNHTISVVNRTDSVYGQVWIDGETGKPGPTQGLTAQLGFGPDGSSPAGNTAWVSINTFNVDGGTATSSSRACSRGDRGLRLRLPLFDDR